MQHLLNLYCVPFNKGVAAQEIKHASNQSSHLKRTNSLINSATDRLCGHMDNDWLFDEGWVPEQAPSH